MSPPSLPSSPHGEGADLQEESIAQDVNQGESSTAPYKYLPKHTFGSIEYPGPISHPTSILKVIHQQDINECFNAPISGENSTNRPILEMRYNGIDEPGGPVRGHRIPSQKLLLKITKRRKKGKEKDEGVFTSEIIGSIPQTVRFRSMADHQWTPDSNGPTAQLVNSLKSLDYNAILDYTFPPLDEEFIEPHENTFDPKIKYRSRLDLQPTPLFSTKNLPYVYNYKMPNQAISEPFFDRRTQTWKKRYVNKARVAGVGPINVLHNHKLGDVPKEPTIQVKNKIGELDAKLLNKLKEAFEERPVWMRYHLFARFTHDERKELQRVKAYIPTVAYLMGTGVFWKCLVKFGYDPCADKNSYKYQRIFFYPNKKTIKTPINVDPLDSEEEEIDETKKKGWWLEKQERLIELNQRPPLDVMKAHIFDGKYLYRERGDYQFGDISDPLISKYINDIKKFKSKCSSQTGWYPNSLFKLIRNLIRIKYMYIWENHLPAPNNLCQNLIDEYENKEHKGDNDDIDDNDDGDNDDGEEENDEDDMYPNLEEKDEEENENEIEIIKNQDQNNLEDENENEV
ncbi:uncharacterized protein I206_103313 [Kwoniella pini CBS 10737]|uniref:Transcription factor IIIC subunit 5 HTH domain-containing protein n=1 Tax=Kwoniella pini CBS 10737 TaxID=1296096 RepID=A0A1B9I9V1_9TREE|nr:uncharacterized protein I206_01681 [Kwoniella pini CBS 10737]OCF52392.1 hypothetical protein I206_01681 [Kwoniella pini CBS 10737]